MLFSDDPAVQLVLFALLLGQQHVAPFFEMGKAPVDTPRVPAVEPDRRIREIGEKAPVVADEHQGSAPRFEISLQPFDCGEIQMVGRFIQKKNVGRRRQRACQRSAARLAAGEMSGTFLPCEAELVEQMPGEMGIIARPETGFHVGQRRREAGKIRLLRQVADHSAWLREDGAAVRFDKAGRDFEQGRFA